VPWLEVQSCSGCAHYVTSAYPDWDPALNNRLCHTLDLLEISALMWLKIVERMDRNGSRRPYDKIPKSADMGVCKGEGTYLYKVAPLLIGLSESRGFADIELIDNLLN
jgi:hypothetical protein